MALYIIKTYVVLNFHSLILRMVHAFSCSISDSLPTQDVVQESKATVPPENSLETQNSHENGTQILNILDQKIKVKNQETLEIMQVPGN